MTLARTHSGDTLVIADVSVRVRYFFIVAFVLNSLCAGACALPRTSITVLTRSRTHALTLTTCRGPTGLICLRVWRVNAELGRLGGKTSTRVFEVVIESGVSGTIASTHRHLSLADRTLPHSGVLLRIPVGPHHHRFRPIERVLRILGCSTSSPCP